MGKPKDCAKCGRVTFNPPGHMVKNGWTRIVVKGQEIWKCRECSKPK